MLYFYLINYLTMINCKLNYCINLALLLILFGCSSGEINDSNDNGNGNGNNGNGNNGNGGNGNGGSGGDNDDETNFYLSSLGSDSNSGSQNNPWKTLSKLSAKELSAGDTVFFKKGDSFNGQLIVKGSGSSDQPIVFTSYGSGDKPIISGSMGSGGGGDNQQAIYVLNNDNMVFNDLEIQNNRVASKSDVDDSDSFGIYIHNTSNEPMNNFVFKNMTFKNVYAITQVDPSNQEQFNSFEVAGLRFFTDWNKSNINNVLVEDSFFTDLQRFGVHVKHSIGGNSNDNRHTNFVFRNNEFKEIGGTCILPSRVRNCLIENNIFDQPGAKTNSRMIGRGSAVWNWYSVNTIIQHNQAIGIRGILDSHGIHVDHNNENTFIQYNYMEDCEGGFVEILGDNENAVYRFNISVNDGWRNNPNWVNSNHTIWLNDKIGGEDGHKSNNSYIYNNTVVINRSSNPYSTAIDIKADKTRIFNNIFYSTNGSKIGGKQVNVTDDNLYMTNNLFFGNIDNRFKDLDDKAVLQNPNFYNEDLSGAKGYQLLAGSPAINSGTPYSGNYSHPTIPVSDSEIFKSLEAVPTVDFFGRSLNVNSTPNIGANNAKNGEITSTYNNDNPYLVNYFVDDKVIFKNLKNNYSYRLFDLIGREIKNGIVYNFNPMIDLNQGLKNGIYEIVIENEKEKISSKFIFNNSIKL